jgi:hypothetical protein
LTPTQEFEAYLNRKNITLAATCGECGNEKYVNLWFGGEDGCGLCSRCLQDALEKIINIQQFLQGSPVDHKKFIRGF